MCGKQGVKGRLGVQRVHVSCGMKRRHYARSKTPVMCKCPFQSKKCPKKNTQMVTSLQNIV